MKLVKKRSLPEIREACEKDSLLCNLFKADSSLTWISMSVFKRFKIKRGRKFC